MDRNVFFIFALLVVFLALSVHPVKSSERSDTEIQKRSVLGFSVKCKNRNFCELHNPSDVIVDTGSLNDIQSELLKRLRNKWGDGNPNLPMWTMGGKQFWEDRFVYGGWHIQRNVFTGHHRLLNPSNVRKAWGSYGACRTVFEGIKQRRGIRLASDHWVFLVHGILRGKESMQPFFDRLRKFGFEPVSVTYPSTRGSVADHADQLTTVLNRVQDADTVSFITHSMGGIVARELLSREAEWKKNLEVGRLVMVAPPNRGSEVADLVASFYPIREIAGEGLEDMTTRQIDEIPIPDVEFGIIAGAQGDTAGLNPFLPGNDDGTVRIEEAYLPQARDFITVPGQHSFIMYDEKVIQNAVYFLRKGQFIEDS
ncbi:MAG: esterase/lipase family protein [bacterium]